MNELELYIRSRYPLIYLVSWEEERMINIIDQMAKFNLRKATFIWSATEGLYNAQMKYSKSPDKTDPLAILEEIEKSSLSAIYILLDFHPFLDDYRVIRKLRDLSHSLKKSYQTIIILSPVLKLPIELNKDCVVIDAPLPSIEELSESLDNLIEKISKTESLEVDLSPKNREKILKASQGLTINELENVISKILAENRRIDISAIPIILKEKKQIIRKTGVLEYYSPEEDLDDIGGLKNLKRWLSKRADAFSDRAKSFGLPAPKGLLLMGVQGCGKSLTAKAVANSWKLPLLRLDVGKIFSGVVGSSEENSRIAIKCAESISPCILWIDEIDKGFSGIDSSNFSDAGTASRVFGYFTTWLQEKEKPVFVIATANNVNLLPPELLRKGRFDEIFFIDLPLPEEREEIFKIHLRKRRRDFREFDLKILSQFSEGFSGAEIEQSIISGLYDAFEGSHPLKDFDILKNIKETIPLSKMMEDDIQFLRNWADKRARKAS